MAEYTIYENDTNLYLSSDMAEILFPLQKRLADSNDAGGFLGSELILTSGYYKIQISNLTKSELKSAFLLNDKETITYVDASEVGL